MGRCSPCSILPYLRCNPFLWILENIENPTSDRVLFSYQTDIIGELLSTRYISHGTFYLPLTELIGELLRTRYISHGTFYLPNRTHRRTTEYDFHRSGISDFIGEPLGDIYIGHVTFQNKTELIGEPRSRRYISQETF